MSSKKLIKALSEVGDQMGISGLKGERALEIAAFTLIAIRDNLPKELKGSREIDALNCVITLVDDVEDVIKGKD